MQIRIIEGCIACNECENVCPEVFTVLETSVADNTQIPGNEAQCREAARRCPVHVIKIQE